MKILYIGHYREGLQSGWSRSALDLISAMDSVGLDVVCRSIKINNSKPELPQRFLELESKSLDGVTHCIQHILPHYMEYNSKVKCIAYHMAETSSSRYSSWPQKLNQMDEVWVTNNSMLDYLKNSEIQIKSRVVPLAVNTEKYNHKETLNLGDGFKFYAIIDLNKRKNLLALLRAFHTEFHRYEPVQLVLKVHPYQIKEIGEICNKIKTSLKLYTNPDYYKKELIIAEDLTEGQIDSLHKSCDCYICPSFNEAWCYPLFDAMGFGNIVISNDIDGPKDYIKHEKNGYLIKNQETTCFNYNETFYDLYTGYEKWYEINIPDLMKKMRYVFENNQDKVRQNAKETVYNYSYEVVGNLIRDKL